MRFDEFLAQNDIPCAPVERFPGFAVSVVLPPEWEPVNALEVSRLWISRNHPRAAEFCPNAVLTMHSIHKALDPAPAFEMLCEQQRQSVPHCRELRSGLAAASEGPGYRGTLALQIETDMGAIDSVTHSRIILSENETLVAQLTVTALHDVPVDHSHIGLMVSVDESPGDTARFKGGAPSGAPVGR